MMTMNLPAPFTRPRRLLLLSVAAAALVLALAGPAARGHEGSRKKLPKTKAAADLKAARAKTDAAKTKLAAAGRYACCTKPSCDLCATVTGSCACAANAVAGKGVCGECYGAWQAGRGSVRGLRRSQVDLLPSCHQASPIPGAPPAELAEAGEALTRAKRTLVAESRYACCVRGGCGVCAHEGDCPCGSDLAARLANPGSKAEGVCGECLDGWKRGQGRFAGVRPEEVPLADMAAMAMRTPAGGPFRSHGALGSGTSLVPASSPVNAWHLSAGDWLGMVHFNARVGLNRQFGPQGVGKLESQNWVMAMAERDAGRGNLMLRGMFSAEPLTAPHGGFPQLFQTGETYRGRPIIDAQHPHDLLMELAAMYTLPLGERAALQLYGAAVGEPALGPPAFMHRASSSENPAPPLGHHGQDSTHITHGVVTLGVQAGAVKVEASGFHGREPDERRGDLELGAIDSWSARLSYAPARDWTMQVSVGRLNEAEAAHPGDVTRTSASVHHNLAWETGNLASALVWGREADVFGHANSYLAESTLNFMTRNHLYVRAELADKGGLLPQRYVPGVIRFDKSVARHPGLPDGGLVPPGFIAIPTRTFFRVGAYTVGYVRDVVANGRVNVGLGADMTVHTAPADLDERYGRTPVGAHVFVRVRPGSGGR